MGGSLQTAQHTTHYITKSENHQWVIKLPIGDFELVIGVLPIFIIPQSPILDPQSPILKTPIPISKSPIGIFTPIGVFHF